jgi:DNA-binding HxlR family transcriptional regulator
MARTHKKVRYSPSSKESKYTPVTAASGVEQAIKFLEGRWKLVILFHLFGGKMLRFSDLERAIPAVSQKMLIQQLPNWSATALSGGSSTTRCRQR